MGSARLLERKNALDYVRKILPLIGTQTAHTPETKPYAADHITNPATEFALVQHKTTTPLDIVAMIMQLNFPYLSATKPGRILPKKEAPLTIEAV